MASKRSRKIMNLHTDIVVIGSGGAGLCAAVAAAENDASVIVLEKLKKPGGNSARAQAFFAAESPAQKRMGIDAPKDVLFKMAMEYAHWEINPRIVRAFINKSGDTVRWLEEKGLRIEQIPTYPYNIPIKTFLWPEGQGAKIIDILVKNCGTLGVSIRIDTAAKEILVHPDGDIKGVLATDKQHDFYIDAHCIVVATGGFGGNKRLLRKYCPTYSEHIRSMGLPHKGDGLGMVAAIGAKTEPLAGIQMEGPLLQGSRNGRSICMEPIMIWVNSKGERFTDESTAINHFESVNALLQQPGKICYSLFDEKIKNLIDDRIQNKLINFRGLLNRFKPGKPLDLSAELFKESTKGTIKISNSLKEIANWMGVDPTVLQTTIDEYNSFCIKGYDDQFLKDSSHLISLSSPPYYAMRCCPVFLTTIGGITINHRMEVLDDQENAIKGLYSAGNDVGGWQPSTYNALLSGSTLGFALNSGRIAGENAAAFLLKK